LISRNLPFISAPPRPSIFLAPKLKDILEKVPDDNAIAVYDFSVINPLTSGMSTKNALKPSSSFFPRLWRGQFVNNEITNQALIDKGQVLVNGVRIALNLQLVE